MLSEAEGLIHSQPLWIDPCSMRQKASCILNAHQCHCCINTFFFSRQRDPTRPEAEGLIAILNLLISLPFIESIDDQKDHQWQLLQVVEGVSKAFKDVAWILCRFTSSFIEARWIYRLTIAIRKRGAPQSIHLVYGIASNSMSISWDLCIWPQLEVIKFLRLYRFVVLFALLSDCRQLFPQFESYFSDGGRSIVHLTLMRLKISWPILLHIVAME
jgi:hypothetical protein